MSLSYTMLAQQTKMKKQTDEEKKLEMYSKKSDSSPKMFFNKSTLLAYGYSEESLANDFKVTPEGLYQPLAKSEKLKEISRAISAKNEFAHPTDAIIGSLPKIKQTEDFEQTSANYHAELEALFAANPSILENLGPAFSKAFNNPEHFREYVKGAIDKGHTIN